MLAVCALRPAWRRHVRLVGAAVLVLVALQVLVEGPRWQLWPAYGAALMAGLLAALGRPGQPGTPRSTALVAVLGALLSGLVGAALPVPALGPLLEGAGPVGTTSWELVDPGRTQPSARAEGEPRLVVAQAWYPAAAATGEPDRITRNVDDFAAAAGGWLGIPPQVLGHLGLATTTARVDAPLAAPDDGLPVVVVLHGWGGFRQAQVLLQEALAADGHLVLALDHTHAALATELLDGTVVPIDPALLPTGAPPPVYDAAATRLQQVFADDVALLLDDLAAGGQVPSDVAAAADLDRLVLLGHSTGGGAAVLACRALEVCDGMLGFDPWVEPLPDDVLTPGLDVPLVSLRSEDWLDDPNERELALLHGASDDQRALALLGTEHRDVTVLPLLTPLAPRIGLAGDLDPMVTQQRTLDVARAFLAEVLGSGGGDPALLDEPADPLVDAPPG